MDANQNHQNSDLETNKPSKNGGSIPISVPSHSSKKSYFQITSVHEDIAPAHMLKEKSESREDIDEGILEPGKVTLPVTSSTTNSNINPASTTSIKSSSNAPAPRFKVVKIPNQVPYKKGRWTCTDSASTSSIVAPSTTDIILTNNKSIKKLLPNVSKILTTTISNTSQSNGVGIQDKLSVISNVFKADALDADKSSHVSSNMTCVQDSNYMVRDVLKNKNAHDILCSNLNFVNNSVFVTTCHTTIPEHRDKITYMEGGDGQTKLDNDSKFDNVAQLNFQNIEPSLYEENHLPMLSTNSKLYSVLSSHTSPSSAYFEDYWKNLKLETISEKFTGSLEELATSSNQAIDNKIELAMDLVKSHLRLAVKSEMDCLRERVRELTLLNERLELENTFLRSRSAPDMSLLPLQKTAELGPTSGQPEDEIVAPLATLTSVPLALLFPPASNVNPGAPPLSKSSSNYNLQNHNQHDHTQLQPTETSSSYNDVPLMSSLPPTTSNFVLCAAISEIFSPSYVTHSSPSKPLPPQGPVNFTLYEPYPQESLPLSTPPLKSPPPPLTLQNRGSGSTFYFSSACCSGTTYNLSSASPPVAFANLGLLLATPLPSLVNQAPIMSSHVWTSPPPSRRTDPNLTQQPRVPMSNGPISANTLTIRDFDPRLALPTSAEEDSTLGLNGYQEHEHELDVGRPQPQPKTSLTCPSTKGQQSNGYPTHLKDHPPSKATLGVVSPPNSVNHKSPPLSSSLNPTTR